MKILVTGGAGFIGSHIVDKLVEAGNQVVVYDNFSTGSIKNLKEVKNKIKIIKGNILDENRLVGAFKGVDVISHHAAQLEIMKAQDNPNLDLDVNTIGTLNVIKAACKNRIKRVLIASSACVYGQPEFLPQAERHPTNPNWSYGVSKLAAEKYAMIFSKKFDMNLTCFRYGIVYGPREWYRRALTIFIKRVVGGYSPVVFSKGVEYRDLVYVKDAALFHNLCINNKKTYGEIYNVSSGKKISIKKLAMMTIKIGGKKLKVKFEDVKEGRKSKYIQGKIRNENDLRGMWLDIDKAKKLGWKPKTSLTEGIKMTIDWHIKNKARWRKVVGSD